MDLKLRIFLYFMFFSLAFARPVLSSVSKNSDVLGAHVVRAQETTEAEKYISTHEIVMETQTAFDQMETFEYDSIPYEIVYEENSEMEYGTEKILTPGENGLITYKYLVTYWQDDIIDKVLLEKIVEDPSSEIVSKGTKIVWRLYSTPDVGRVKYWYKLRVWATKYDANCIGCTGRTFSGTEVKKGVCATDPSVIPLGTNFYVDGYGLCRAEDIGGAIKGNDVDLGFKDASKATWGAAYTDVYLLTNAPY